MAWSQPCKQDLQGALSMLTAYFSIFWRIHLQTTDFSFISTVAVFGGKCNETGHASFWVGMAGVPWKPVVTGCCCSCVVIEQERRNLPYFPYGGLFWGMKWFCREVSITFLMVSPFQRQKEWWELQTRSYFRSYGGVRGLYQLEEYQKCKWEFEFGWALEVSSSPKFFPLQDRSGQTRPAPFCYKIKISVPWEKVVYATLWSMMGLQMRWTMGFFRCCWYQTLSWEYELIPDFPVHGISLFC